VHAAVTFTRFKVKVKVTGLLNFRKLARPCMLAAMTVSPHAELSGFRTFPTSQISLKQLSFDEQFKNTFAF